MGLPASLVAPSTHELADKAGDGQQLGFIQATDNILDHRGHDPARAGYPKIGGLLHHKTHLGDAQRLEEIVVQPSVGQFHHEITQRTAVLGRVGGVLQGLQQLERLGVELFGIAEAQRGRLG